MGDPPTTAGNVKFTTNGVPQASGGTPPIYDFLVNLKKFDNVFAIWEFEKFLPNDRTYKVLQVGVFTGDATDWLLKNRNVEFIHDVDIWQDVEGVHREGHNAEVEEYYDSRFAGESKVVKFKMTSDEFFVTEGTTHTYNFIYIDGDHSASQATIDGLNAFRVLDEGGILAFDDFLWDSFKGAFYEPKVGIRSVLRITRGHSRVLHMARQVWIVKTAGDRKVSPAQLLLIKTQDELGYLVNLSKIKIRQRLVQFKILR
jgi:hypothetical protein